MLGAWMAGGAFLCFEGAEKLWEKLNPHDEAAAEDGGVHHAGSRGPRRRARPAFKGRPAPVGAGPGRSVSRRPASAQWLQPNFMVELALADLDQVRHGLQQLREVGAAVA